MRIDFELLIETELDMERLGSIIGDSLLGGDVLYLSGVLGAGKTTLTRGILMGLGFSGRVTSPTFTLMNIYQAAFPVYHFDFYRLEGSELYELGLDDYLGQDGVCIIEWPETGSALLPEDALWIHIRLKGDNYDLGRLVSFEPCGRSAHLLFERLQAHVNFSY